MLKTSLRFGLFLIYFVAKKKDENELLKWRWVNGKQSGNKPSQRCGMSMVVTTGNKAICFGGVFDEVIMCFLFNFLAKYHLESISTGPV